MKHLNSYYTLILFLCLILVVFRFLVEPIHILSWDVFGYYLYLPAKFIYNDITVSDISWLNQIIETYEPTATLYQAVKLDNGNLVMKYSMGLSFLYSPFFFLAHLLSGPLGYPADGFSLPYQYILAMGGLIYAFIGLIFLSKVLHHFFSKLTSIIVILIIFFGTNYFHLTAFDGTLLSHNHLFTLYAILVYYTIRWNENQKWKYALIIGLSVGLITLIRPTEAICILIPLFWFNSSKDYISSKFALFQKNWYHIVIVAVSAFLVVLPQLIYWKEVTGEYLFYSYTNPGEGLDFLSPHTWNFLFSFRKGWFIYTPLIIFAFAGLYFLAKKNFPVFLAIFIFVVSDVYLSSTWTTWWYAGGSFSSRSMVPAYVLLAIPLGYLVERIKRGSTAIKSVFTLSVLLLILINLFQTWQFRYGIISKERMTRAYYFATFGKTSVSDEDKKLLLVDRSVESVEYFKNKEAYSGKVIYENTFEDQTDTIQGHTAVLVMNENRVFSPGLDIKFEELTVYDHAWIKASAKLFFPETHNEEPPLLVVSFHHKNKAYKYRTRTIKPEDIDYGEWNTLSMDYLTPEVRSSEDNMKVYLWYRSKGTVLVNSLVVEAFEPVRN